MTHDLNNFNQLVGEVASSPSAQGYLGKITPTKNIVYTKKDDMTNKISRQHGQAQRIIVAYPTTLDFSEINLVSSLHHHPCILEEYSRF